MNNQRFLIIFTIWCVKSSVADDNCPMPFVTIINECNRGCGITRVASCTCSGTPSITFKDVNKTACSIEPILLVHNGLNAYDLMLNNTFDLDQDCMSTTSLQGKIMCGQLPVQFIINIMPENEFPPWFCYLNTTPIRNPEIIVVNETLPKGGRVWDFNVCDKDKFDTTAKQVTIKSLLDGLFEINEHNNIFTLKLTTHSTLDHDQKKKYFLELQILDGIFTNVTLNLTINVMDVDNKPPAFDQPIYYMNVNEEQPKNTYFGKMHAADEDKGIIATLHYQLESVNGSDLFWIDKYSGNLYTNATFDRENVESYYLVVKAYQEDNPINRFTFATVEVKINDVDDNPPVMSQKDYYATIQENAPKDSLVIQIQATDADKDETNTKLFFEIVNPDPWHAFSLNSSTGIILVGNQSALDFETWTETTMIVRAVSLHHGNMFSDNSIIHISLTDMNDNSPQCGKDPDCTIHKDAHVTGNPICQVVATDPDLKGNGNVSYSVLSDDNELIPFAINNATGAIILTKTISWLYVTKYRLDVVVEDHPQFLSEKRSTVCVVFIHVADVDMVLPVIFSPLNGSEVNIAEGASPPTILLRVNASAKDPSDNLEYKIDGGMGYFEIDHSSGVIHVSKTLDREQISSYIITVSVSDRVNHTSQSTFLVNVLGINENSPIFLSTLYTFQIVEETPDTFLYVKAHDRDFGPNGEVEYEFQNNHWSSHITINHTTGEIHVQSIDRENLNDGDEIQLLVIAKDHGIPEQYGLALIKITVKDINDHAPTFKEATRTFDLKEGYKGVFYHAQAFDPDYDVSAIIHYRIINGDESILGISDTGDISLWQPLVLDGRINDSIALVIEAYNTVPYTNQNITNGRQTLIIHIQDINDKYPVFSSSLYKVNVHRTLQTGSFVASVLATDKDYSSEYNTVTYWIAGGDNDNTFNIDSRTGNIYLQKPINFAPPNNQRSFSLTIQASDLHRNVNGSVVNATTTLYITLLDDNDNFPTFMTVEELLCKCLFNIHLVDILLFRKFFNQHWKGQMRYLHGVCKCVVPNIVGLYVFHLLTTQRQMAVTDV